MLTSKQRAFLRGMANGMDAIFQVGKNGVTPELRDTVYNALEARELVKISVLDNNMLGAREAAEMLASRTGAEVVQVIGNKFVLYRAAKKPVIELPQASHPCRPHRNRHHRNMRRNSIAICLPTVRTRRPALLPYGGSACAWQQTAICNTADTQRSPAH